MDISELSLRDLESLCCRQREVFDMTQENLRVIFARLAVLRQSTTKENDTPDPEIASEVIDTE